MGRLAKQGPPAGAGRWSLVAQITSPAPSPTKVAVARATQLLERYGVLTREMALAEGTEAGFAGVYPVLKLMEEQGKIRRGYFLAGLGAAQFARSGAVDQLRDARTPAEHEASSAVLLAATDPAQPYGAVLAWPASEGRPSRSAGARVVLVDGLCAAFVERNAKSVLLFDVGVCDPVADVLTDQLAPRARRMELATVNGASVSESALFAPLQKRGWKVSYRGLRPPDPARH
jgi:ATP-dependent Lhr-like helicase